MMRKILILIYYVLLYHFPNSRYVKFPTRIRTLYLQRVLGIMKSCDLSKIQNNVYISDFKNIKIGFHCHINENVFIQAAIIGDHVMIAPGTSILSKSHCKSRTDLPMILQGETENSIPLIENDVWIGRNVIIMPGVRIGEGSVVGAGAVVTKDVPPYSICCGVPARVINNRKSS